MTQIVVDSSVVIKWFVAEVHSAEALRLLGDFRAGTLELLAPDLLCVEFGSIVWKKQRFQGLPPADAQSSIDDFQTLRFHLTSTADLLADAFHLATTHQRSVYDMMYLALSARANCEFVTADQKLFNALSGVFPNLKWIANWP